VKESLTATTALFKKAATADDLKYTERRIHDHLRKLGSDLAKLQRALPTMIAGAVAAYQQQQQQQHVQYAHHVQAAPQFVQQHALSQQHSGFFFPQHPPHH